MRPELAALFTRPFWLDEWHTALVANRGTIAEVFTDLHRGSDMGPPATHVIFWLAARLGGEITPIRARVISFVVVLLALVFVFLTLRRHFGRWTSVIAAASVATQGIVVTYAFELRYYCFWLMFAAAFAWCLGVDDQRAVSRRRDVGLAALSVLLCLTHWLAVISLAIMCAGAVAASGRDWRRGVRRVIPALAGVVALAACLPLLLGQWAAVVEKSWMPDATLADVWRIVAMYWGGTIFLLSLVVLVFGVIRTDVRHSLRDAFARIVRDPGTAALMANVATPLAMTIVSIAYPSLNPRYAILTTFAWAPALALAIHTSRWLVRSALVAVVVAYLLGGVANVTLIAMNFATNVAVSRKALARACEMGIPVVFHARHVLYPATRATSGDWARCDVVLLGVSHQTLNGMYPAGSYVPRFFRFETEIAQLHHRLYGYPRVAADSALREVPRLVLVGWDAAFPEGYDAARFGRAVFPDRRATRIGEALTLLER